MSEQEKTKKTRKRRPAEVMAQLVLEAEKIGASKVCQREGIAPAQLSRWKQKFLQAGIQGLKELKVGKKKTDPKIAALERETARLKEALLETSIELQAIKKNDR